jgi:phosphatidylethanolamine-binding protein
MKLKIKIKKSQRRKRTNTKRHTRKQKGGQSFEVFYGLKKVLGQELSKSETVSAPSVTFPQTGKIYTLIMWDPDVPEQFQPGWAHWIAVNLQSPNDISSKQLLSYSGPAPPKGTGIHRYFFGLFEQQQDQINPQQPTREKFSVNNFITQNNLFEVAKVFMTVSAT